MKKRIYLRLTNKGKGKVVASTKPIFKSLDSGPGHTKYYPTVFIALDLDIPDKEFTAARIQLEAKITSTEPAVELRQVEDDNYD